MVFSETKMIVAQNCNGYNARSVISMMSMGTLSVSCSNCTNYIHGQCSKDLFDHIADMIRMN